MQSNYGELHHAVQQALVQVVRRAHQEEVDDERAEEDGHPVEQEDAKVHAEVLVALPAPLVAGPPAQPEVQERLRAVLHAEQQHHHGNRELRAGRVEQSEVHRGADVAHGALLLSAHLALLGRRRRRRRLAVHRGRSFAVHGGPALEVHRGPALRIASLALALLLVLDAVRGHERREVQALAHELVVRAHLGDAPVFNHHHAVRLREEMQRVRR